MNTVNLALEEAIGLLLTRTPVKNTTEMVPLLAAVGRIAAVTVVAPMDQPPFDRSPLDGYTFAAADTVGATADQPKALQVMGEVCAGHCLSGAPMAGQAVRIMTGAPIPKNCDCVIGQEDVQLMGDVVLIPREIQRHQNYCFRGEDIKAGAELIAEGTLLTHHEIGVLAGMGYGTLAVYCLPVVAICSTGDELALAGRPLTMGRIYNSSLYTLAARLQELGITPLILGQVPDDAVAVAELIAQHSGQVDLFLTTGGVSVGKMDIMHEVIGQLGAERLFWRVNMKPGTPILSYCYGELLCIALSGNPHGALATFELLVRPVLAKLGHNPHWQYQRTTAVLTDAFPKASQGRRLIRAHYDGLTGQVHLPEKQQLSGTPISAMGCNAMIDMPPGREGLQVGDVVQVVVL